MEERGGWDGKGRERERRSQCFYSTASHVYCHLFTAFPLFLCLSCPPSERVLFSQLLVIEGGRKQTQIKAQALVQRLCVCGLCVIEINAGVKTAAADVLCTLCSAFDPSPSSLFALPHSVLPLVLYDIQHTNPHSVTQAGLWLWAGRCVWGGG